MLSDPNSIHTKRWIKALAARQYEIYLIGFGYEDDYYREIPGIKVSVVKRKGLISFFKIIKLIYNAIKNFRPSILHSHYASSYGFLGAIFNFHPFIVSFWGSDIYEFPKISIIHRLIIMYNIYVADKLLSTSYIMADEVKKYTSKDVLITPFGVEVDLFKKIDLNTMQDELIIGNVKTLAYNYGIDILIYAFNIVQNKINQDVKLCIIGDGPDKHDFYRIVKELHLTEKVIFLGRVNNEDLPIYYSSFNVAVYPSINESFGVAAVEAMSCECPVVASDADGFKEVIENNVTGLIVPRNNVEATANAIITLLEDKQLAKKMGKNGRNRVKELYSWESNVDTMSAIYLSL